MRTQEDIKLKINSTLYTCGVDEAAAYLVFYWLPL